MPKKLTEKINQRREENALRQLGKPNYLVDFSSNDYLGFSKSETIFNNTHDYLVGHNIKLNGATGSRLLSGNHTLYPIAEEMLCNVHNSEAALVFNSGYDANVGFFSSVPQRDDIILYDAYIHASIRDGITMSKAKAYKFRHNDLTHLKELLKKNLHNTTVFVVTESIFSMDGDSPNLKSLIEICTMHNAYPIIDEAHAVGVFGENGVGLTQALGLEQKVFARLITFGKALGCHGAAILGSDTLKQYLINFSRSFIYTTALPPHSLATILSVYNNMLKKNQHEKKRLQTNIAHFKSEIKTNNLAQLFIKSESAIHCCIISGNTKVKTIAEKLKDKGFDVKPILSPTVPKGEERLRFCLHSYNSLEEISEVLRLLAIFVI